MINNAIRIVTSGIPHIPFRFQVSKSWGIPPFLTDIINTKHLLWTFTGLKPRRLGKNETDRAISESYGHPDRIGRIDTHPRNIEERGESYHRPETHNGHVRFGLFLGGDSGQIHGPPCEGGEHLLRLRNIAHTLHTSSVCAGLLPKNKVMI